MIHSVNGIKINVGEYRMDTPKKLTTWGTQDDDKQNKKHNAICVGHRYSQTNTNNVNKTYNVSSPTKNW
jgi:hypothetical protein